MVILPTTLTPDWLRKQSALNQNVLAAALLQVALQAANCALRGQRVGPHSADDIAQDVVLKMMTRILPVRAIRFWRAYVQTLTRSRIHHLRRKLGNAQIAFSTSSTYGPRGDWGHDPLSIDPAQQFIAVQLSPVEEVWFRQTLGDVVVESLRSAQSVVEAFACIGYLAGYGNGPELQAWLRQAFPELVVPSVRSIQRLTKRIRDRAALKTQHYKLQ